MALIFQAGQAVVLYSADRQVQYLLADAQAVLTVGQIDPADFLFRISDNVVPEDAVILGSISDKRLVQVELSRRFSVFAVDRSLTGL